MDLYPYIFKRKSTRKYKMTSLPKENLEVILEYTKTLNPLYPNIDIAFELVTQDSVRNLLPIKAPYYFVISSEKKDGYLENAGFMGQQLDLFLSSKSLGSCWLGLAKTKNSFKSNLDFVIILAFGESEESPHREINSFNRKSLSEISNFSDIRLEPCRLAPSATNSQNWYFYKNTAGIDLYRKKLNMVEALAYDKMNAIDMGIVLCHFNIASIRNKMNFVISKKTNYEKLDKLIYVCTIN